MNDDWRNNPKLAGMDRSKLDMLQNLASQGSSKGANEMLPFLMSAAAQGKKGGDQVPTHCLLLFADSAENLPDSVNMNCYDNKKSTFHQLSEMYSYVQ